MSKHKLKANQPDFEVVDGPLAGRKFLAGQVYAEIPPTESARFEKIKDESPQSLDSGALKPNKPGFGVRSGLNSAIRNPQSEIEGG